jgi:hypothetical protein
MTSFFDFDKRLCIIYWAIQAAALCLTDILFGPVDFIHFHQPVLNSHSINLPIIRPHHHVLFNRKALHIVKFNPRGCLRVPLISF